MEFNITGNPHVRFDEQGVETDLREPDLAPRESKRNKYTPDPNGTAPPLDSTVIHVLRTPCAACGHAGGPGGHRVAIGRPVGIVREGALGPVFREPQRSLLDLLLPGTDGIELMQSLSALAGRPVIFMSAYGCDETIATALESGAADYIVKPCGKGSEGNRDPEATQYIGYSIDHRRQST